jgi:hypothetical protein
LHELRRPRESWQRYTLEASAAKIKPAFGFTHKSYFVLAVN